MTRTTVRKISYWVSWILGSLMMAVMVFAMAGTGVMFIMQGDWLTNILGWGCLTLSVILVTLMFLIVHTMDH